MRSILTLAIKDLRLLSRDWFGLFWIVAFPLVYAGFFGAIFGGGGGGSRAPMRVAIVDEDRSEQSQKLITRLAAHSSLAVERGKAASEGAERPVRRHTREQAAEFLRRGNKVGFFLIKKGFGESGFAFLTGNGPNLLGLGVDPTRKAESGYLQGILMETAFEQMSSAWTAGKKREEVEVVPVARDQTGRPRSAFEVTFPSAVLWGLMGCAAAFAITIVRERTAGTLLRLRIAPLTRTQLLAGKGLACFLCCIFTIVLLLTIGRLALGVRLGNPLYLTMAVGCTAACFTGIMMAMSMLGKTEQAVAGAGWGIMMPFAMLGGGMVPLIAMPRWMLTASNFSPFKWGIYAIEGAVWRDFSLSEMLGPCGILLGIGAAFFTIGVLVFRKMEG